MAVAVALWSAVVRPGEPLEFAPPSDLRITNIALGDTLADESGRTTVKLTYLPPYEAEEDDEDDEGPEPQTTVLCSLTPGKIEQAVVDIVLEGDEEAHIEVVGKNTIYLTGNYIDQSPLDQGPFDDEFESRSEMEGYDLEDVSSDVEVNPAELDMVSGEEDDTPRFEEITDEITTTEKHTEKLPITQKGVKRGRESDVMDTDLPSAPKKERKKLNKKLKGEGGMAVPVGEGSAPTSPETIKISKDKKGDKASGKPDVKKASDKPTVNGDAKKTTEKDSVGEVKTLAGGLKVDERVVGTGKLAKKGSQVSMRYIGKLENGKVFDKNTKGKPFVFDLGAGEVIKGWDEGIVGMQVGGERILTVPPKLAYGNKKQADIPAGSTLVFEVKLLDVK